MSTSLDVGMTEQEPLEQQKSKWQKISLLVVSTSLDVGMTEQEPLEQQKS